MEKYADYSLLKHNTFGIDVKCDHFIVCSSVNDVQAIAPLLATYKKPFMVIGEGSNLLFTQNYKGIILYSTIKGIEITDNEDHILMRCGSGEIWDDVVKYSVERGYSGLENLSYIPGMVGASAVQNIGAYGAEAKDVIETIETVNLFTGEIRTFTNEECGYAYRDSKFKKAWKGTFFITHVTYRLSKTFIPNLHYGNILSTLATKGIVTPTVSQVRDVIIEIRKAKLPDPKDEGNAGSFFMNPIVERAKYEALEALYPEMPHYFINEEHEKIPAGWLIEECGWKGKTLGRAGVHHKQALVLVNKGGATGAEVVTLCNTIRKDIENKFGISISPEVNIL